jgi:predicted N-acetyltransferase YhbS
MAHLRPMTDADVEPAVEVWGDAFAALADRYRLAAPSRTPETTARLAQRLRHFRSTDPGGSFVADDGGVVVGLSQSLVREGYWMLSLLGIHPSAQGRGLGRDLLDLALSTAPRDSAGTIQSSRDPSAMALYTLAGFALHPALMATGRVRPGAVGRHRSVRTGSREDIALVDAVDRAVRGSARGIDIVAMLSEPRTQLLVAGDRGYVVATDERVVTLGARDEATAMALLESALALGGGDIEVGWMTAGQQWAIRTVVGAGLLLNPSGAVMTRGMPGPPRPYLPSGGYG